MNQCPNFNCASINHDSAAYCQNCGTPLKMQNTESSVNHLQEALGHDHEFIQQLGEGGMGTVWKARHINLDQYRAIKLLHSELVSNPKIKKWALNEGRKLAKIKNPHVITVYDCRETETTVALFMDYINDGSLADLLAKKVKLSWHEAKSIIIGILDGLEAVHKNGIVHRDIKPDNVLLANQNGLMRPIIIDFGIAIDGNGSRVTRTGAQAGTYEYMSPEQIKTGTATEQSDIYSAGIMLYEVLVGELPFLAEEDFALMEQHVRQEPDLTKLPNDTPSYVRDAIGLALAKSPQERFNSCTEFSAALNHEAGKDQANSVKVGPRITHGLSNGQPINPNVHAKDQFNNGGGVNQQQYISPDFQAHSNYHSPFHNQNSIQRPQTTAPPEFNPHNQFQSQGPKNNYQTAATNPSGNHLRHIFTFGIVVGIALVILLALNLKKDPPPPDPCKKPNPPSYCNPPPSDPCKKPNPPSYCFKCGPGQVFIQGGKKTPKSRPKLGVAKYRRSHQNMNVSNFCVDKHQQSKSNYNSAVRACDRRGGKLMSDAQYEFAHVIRDKIKSYEFEWLKDCWHEDYIRYGSSDINPINTDCEIRDDKATNLSTMYVMRKYDDEYAYYWPRRAKIVKYRCTFSPMKK